MKKYIAVMAVFIIVLQASFLATTVFAANNYILETADYGDIRDTMSFSILSEKHIPKDLIGLILQVSQKTSIQQIGVHINLIRDRVKPDA